MTGFRALGLSNETLQALDQKGFEKPTPIQELTIPLLLEGEKDIVGQAQTGSGKTAAFGIPILEKFDSQSRGVQALILAPTRELAIQVADELASYKGNRRIKITTVYGGAPISKQMRELERGTDIVVGTPGRVIDMIERKKLKLDEVRFVVLDEADEMLNMGFLDDVELILSKCDADRRMLLFSATMPRRILTLAKRYMGAYELIEVENKGLTTATIAQSYYQVPARNRFDALCRILAAEEDFYGIVFCNTKMAVVEITNSLNERGYNADSLHGDIAQNLREKVINQFKRNEKGVLVATDVAARGIDIQDLSHVINYGLPQDPESYVHRIGRTGRAGKEGKAISIIDNNELRKLRFIQNATNSSIQKANLPEATDVVKMKKARLLEKIDEVISANEHVSLMEYTYEAMEDKDPALVIAALLHIFQGDDLNPRSYKDIKNISGDSGRERGRGRDQDRDNDRGRGGRRDSRSRGRDDDRGSGSTMRLFVAMGRKDNLSPVDILELVENEANVAGRNINGIKILDAFSFFTTNNQDGQHILDVFKKKARDEGVRAVIEQAKERI